MPNHVGTWVFEVDDSEFTKWGKDGDTRFPFPPDDRDAINHAKYLSEQPNIGQLYILHVFDNGQMKQFAFDVNEFFETGEQNGEIS